MNTIVTNNLNKLKSWTKRLPSGKVALVKPQDSLEFSIAMTIVQRAIDSGVLKEDEAYAFITKDLAPVKKIKFVVKVKSKGKKK